MIREKLIAAKSLVDVSAVIVPGIRPYRDHFQRIRASMIATEPAVPITREELCIKCGKCAEVCPNAAI
jgi:ferredoxin